jgi:hypothetical protein
MITAVIHKFTKVVSSYPKPLLVSSSKLTKSRNNKYYINVTAVISFKTHYIEFVFI